MYGRPFLLSLGGMKTSGGFVSNCRVLRSMSGRLSSRRPSEPTHVASTPTRTPIDAKGSTFARLRSETESTQRRSASAFGTGRFWRSAGSISAGIKGTLYATRIPTLSWNDLAANHKARGYAGRRPALFSASTDSSAIFAIPVGLLVASMNLSSVSPVRRRNHPNCRTCPSFLDSARPLISPHFRTRADSGMVEP